MTIHCENPNTISSEAEAMFNVTNTLGKSLIEKLANSINDLKSHWKGSDAVVNISDLIGVYTDVTTLVKRLQDLIVSLNNQSVIPLQKEIVADGGTCTIGSELAKTLGGIEDTIAVPTDSGEVWTDQAIITDADTFNGFPGTFENFVNELNGAKDVLLKNWLEGAGRENVVNAFKSFNENVPNYKTKITSVRDNLNTIASNKKTLLR